MAGAKSDKLHYEQLKYFKQLAEENLGYVRDLFMENSGCTDIESRQVLRTIREKTEDIAKMNNICEVQAQVYELVMNEISCMPLEEAIKVNVIKRVKKEVAEKLKKTSNLNLTKFPMCIELEAEIAFYERMNQANTADKDDNEDIVVFAPMVNIARMDPFTQQAIVTPMKNTVCGHVYDKRGIEQMMKLGSNFQCPCIGCCNKEPITMDSVTHDYEYAAWQRYYASQGTSKSTTDILNLSDTH